MDKKILVAYFPASGKTKKAAQTLVKTLGADEFEIKAKIPYTQADLDWNDNNSRCVKEWQDKDSRPEICPPMPDMKQYDTIFIGYPIWWEASPNIIYTFLESYDFSSKTIVPFSTSGGSVRGSSGTHLHQYCSEQTNWKPGKLLNNPCSISSWGKKVLRVNSKIQNVESITCSQLGKQ